MKQILLFTTLIIAGVSASAAIATSYNYQVTFINRTDEPITIETQQYSNSGKGDRPEFFGETDTSHHDHKKFVISPRGHYFQEYSDVVGGFWIRWKAIGKCESWPVGGTIDLTGPIRVVEIHDYKDCPASP